MMKEGTLDLKTVNNGQVTYLAKYTKKKGPYKNEVHTMKFEVPEGTLAETYFNEIWGYKYNLLSVPKVGKA